MVYLQRWHGWQGRPVWRAYLKYKDVLYGELTSSIRPGRPVWRAYLKSPATSCMASLPQVQRRHVWRANGKLTSILIMRACFRQEPTERPHLTLRLYISATSNCWTWSRGNGWERRITGSTAKVQTRETTLTVQQMQQGLTLSCRTFQPQQRELQYIQPKLSSHNRCCNTCSLDCEEQSLKTEGHPVLTWSGDTVKWHAFGLTRLVQMVNSNQPPFLKLGVDWASSPVN